MTRKLKALPKRNRAHRFPVRSVAAEAVDNCIFQMDNYIHKAALVEALGVSTRTLENWCAHRDFPKARRLAGSRLAFFRVADVEAWLDLALEAGGQQ